MKQYSRIRTCLAGVLAAFVCMTATAQSEKPESTPPPSAEQPKLLYVLMTTNKGDIVIELNREKAPISVDNFLSYVDKKFYDGTIFHRVMSTFMIQGGGFTPDMQQKEPDPPIKNEWQNGLKNTRGSIAMARLGGQPDSATCQFFINVVDNPALDTARDGAAYAVFGTVVAGMNTVDAIKVVPVTTKSGHQNVPVDTVKIEKVTRLSAVDAKKKIEAEKKPAAPATPSSN